MGPPQLREGIFRIGLDYRLSRGIAGERWVGWRLGRLPMILHRRQPIRFVMPAIVDRRLHRQLRDLSLLMRVLLLLLLDLGRRRRWWWLLLLLLI